MGDPPVACMAGAGRTHLSLAQAEGQACWACRSVRRLWSRAWMRTDRTLRQAQDAVLCTANGIRCIRPDGG